MSKFNLTRGGIEENARKTAINVSVFKMVQFSFPSTNLTDNVVFNLFSVKLQVNKLFFEETDKNFILFLVLLD